MRLEHKLQCVKEFWDERRLNRAARGTIIQRILHTLRWNVWD